MTPEREMRARTILAQLTKAPLDKAVGRLRAMLGTTDVIVVKNGGVRFNFKGCRKYSWCEISLNGSDLYDLTFFRITRRVAKTEEFEDIHVDALEEMFHSVTGLHTHL